MSLNLGTLILYDNNSKDFGGFINRFIKNNRGITLVEVMIVVAISGIITAIVFAVHINQERIYVGEETFMNMYRNTTSAIDNMTRTLRLTGYNPQETSQFIPGFRYGGYDSVEIVIDYDGDGLLTSSETVSYSLKDFSGSGIDSLRFLYLNQRRDNLPVPVPADSLDAINSVLVTVVMRNDKKVAGPERYELSREIKIRN